jgi:uncharacterized protein (TIGR00252 family)
MTTTETGQRAENAAADYLRERGYEILAQNWKIRVCEIDIVARKDETLHCVEVKYRKSNVAGGGLDYITKTKLQQMRFAAEQWAAAHKWDSDINLAAIEVSGSNFEITHFIDSIY